MADQWRNKYQVHPQEMDLQVPKEWDLSPVIDLLIDKLRAAAIRQGEADPIVTVHTLNGIPIAVGVGGWLSLRDAAAMELSMLNRQEP